MSNFGRFFNLPLSNCEIELNLSWSKYFIISEISRTDVVVVNMPNPATAATETTGPTSQKNNTNISVPIVTFLINENVSCLRNLKQWFKRTISGNKYNSEIATQIKNNNLDYMID